MIERGFYIIKDKFFEDMGSIFDLFPISEKYIAREYTIANNQMKVTSEHSAMEIEKKARKVMNMLKRGIKFTPTQPNINLIIEKLKQDF